MAAAREPPSEYERTLALVHVQYELEMCAASATRAATPNGRDDVEANAYLESTLLHARNLYEFLVANRKSPRDDDLLRADFTRRDWSASEHAPEAVRRLASAIPDVNKHLSHLTWARGATSQPPRGRLSRSPTTWLNSFAPGQFTCPQTNEAASARPHGHSKRSQPPTSGDHPAEDLSQAPTRANARPDAGRVAGRPDRQSEPHPLRARSRHASGM